MFVAAEQKEDTWGFRAATWISYLINPLILPPIQFGLVLAHFGADSRETGLGIGIGLVFFFAIPLAFVATMVLRGDAATLEVRSRNARTRPFLFGIASYLIGILALWKFIHTALPLILVLAALYPINTFIIALINLRWKISVHVASIGGFVAALSFIAWNSWDIPSTGLLSAATVTPLLLFIPLLMWARVRSGAHTTAQVVGGVVLGFGATLLELAFFASEIV